MISDEMIRRLQAEFGDIGGINARTLTAEERSNRMDEGTTNEYGLSNPALMRQTEFGKGLSNIRPATFSSNRDPLATEYGIIPSEQTATPTSYRADLTAPDKEGYYLTGDFTPQGKMIGSPKREKYEPDWFRKNQNLMLALPGLVAGGAGLLAGGFGGAGGVSAASLGELGINTGLTLGETLAGTGISEAALGELSFNTGLTAAESASAAEAASALSTPWYQPFQQGLESLKDFTDVGKYFTEAPAGVQKAITGGARNLLLSGGDPEAALRGAVTGGLGDFVDSYIPKDLQSVAKAGVQTALQGGNLEDMLKNSFGALSGEVSSAITGATGSKWAGDIANAAIKQVITSGTIDPSKITAGMLAQVAGRAVSSETGNESLGRAATTAVLGAVKGTDLDKILKQVAIGAISTPTKKG